MTLRQLGGTGRAAGDRGDGHDGAGRRTGRRGDGLHQRRVGEVRHRPETEFGDRGEAVGCLGAQVGRDDRVRDHHGAQGAPDGDPSGRAPGAGETAADTGRDDQVVRRSGERGGGQRGGRAGGRGGRADAGGEHIARHRHSLPRAAARTRRAAPTSSQGPAAAATASRSAATAVTTRTLIGRPSRLRCLSPSASA